MACRLVRRQGQAVLDRIRQRAPAGLDDVGAGADSRPSLVRRLWVSISTRVTALVPSLPFRMRTL